MIEEPPFLLLAYPSNAIESDLRGLVRKERCQVSPVEGPFLKYAVFEVHEDEANKRYITEPKRTQ